MKLYDVIEGIRRYWFPKLDPIWPMSQLGVSEKQYVGTTELGEVNVERKLLDAGFEPNPLAGYKIHRDGRESQGSWRATHADLPELVPQGMQCHVTVFKSQHVYGGIDLYAHLEDDYSWSLSRAVDHVHSKRFDAAAGVAIAKQVLDEPLNVYDPR